MTNDIAHDTHTSPSSFIHACFTLSCILLSQTNPTTGVCSACNVVSIPFVKARVTAEFTAGNTLSST